jgi:hypothetical protein
MLSRTTSSNSPTPEDAPDGHDARMKRLNDLKAEHQKAMQQIERDADIAIKEIRSKAHACRTAKTFVPTLVVFAVLMIAMAGLVILAEMDHAKRVQRQRASLAQQTTEPADPPSTGFARGDIVPWNGLACTVIAVDDECGILDVRLPDATLTKVLVAEVSLADAAVPPADDPLAH